MSVLSLKYKDRVIRFFKTAWLNAKCQLNNEIERCTDGI
jgi:hypothetical protein